MTQPVVRFAPSPTGRIHIGNTRTALLNYLFAKAHGGRYVLRFDDTDRERSREEYARSIAEDLDWLGIHPDLVVRQSDRTALYAAATRELKQAGLFYPAYETPDELDRRRKRMQARGLPPVYDRAALKLTSERRSALEADGRRPHWRFKLRPETVAWDDLVRGASHIDCASLSDPVLVREDGTCLYTLTSVVDDMALGVSHIIRGEDHVTNTAVQIQLFQALGGRVPVFGHHNLLTTASGEGLSKRSGALSVASLRDSGIEALAVVALATLNGSSVAVHPIAALDDLTPEVNLSNLSRNPAKFDEAELRSLSAKTLHGLPFTAVAGRLAGLGIEGEDAEPFWTAVRGNLDTLRDASVWWDVVYGRIEPKIEDAAFLALALEHLPPEPWDLGTWGAWTDRLKAASGRKGKALFHPLRLALTSREMGPDLRPLLPFIGRVKALARLGGAAA